MRIHSPRAYPLCTVQYPRAYPLPSIPICVSTPHVRAYPLCSIHVHIHYPVYSYAYPLPTCLSITLYLCAYPLASIPICVSTIHVLIHYAVSTSIMHIHYPVFPYAYPLPTCLSITQYLRAYPLPSMPICVSTPHVLIRYSVPTMCLSTRPLHSTHMRINYPSAYPLNSTSVLIHYLVLMCLSITE